MLVMKALFKLIIVKNLIARQVVSTLNFQIYSQVVAEASTYDYYYWLNNLCPEVSSTLKPIIITISCHFLLLQVNLILAFGYALHSICDYLGRHFQPHSEFAVREQ